MKGKLAALASALIGLIALAPSGSSAVWASTSADADCAASFSATAGSDEVGARLSVSGYYEVDAANTDAAYADSNAAIVILDAVTISVSGAYDGSVPVGAQSTAYAKAFANGITHDAIAETLSTGSCIGFGGNVITISVQCETPDIMSPNAAATCL